MMVPNGSFLERPAFRGRWWSLGSQQVKLASIQQFPLNGFSAFQTDRSG